MRVAWLVRRRTGSPPAKAMWPLSASRPTAGAGGGHEGVDFVFFFYEGAFVVVVGHGDAVFAFHAFRQGGEFFAVGGVLFGWHGRAGG